MQEKKPNSKTENKTKENNLFKLMEPKYIFLL